MQSTPQRGQTAHRPGDLLTGGQDKVQLVTDSASSEHPKQQNVVLCLVLITFSVVGQE